MLLSWVVYGVKNFRYICITKSVHVLIKAGGLRCTGWGGGFKSTKGQYPPLHVMFEHICVMVVVFFSLSRFFYRMYAYIRVTQSLYPNKVFLNE